LHTQSNAKLREADQARCARKQAVRRRAVWTVGSLLCWRLLLLALGRVLSQSRGKAG